MRNVGRVKRGDLLELHYVYNDKPTYRKVLEDGTYWVSENCYYAKVNGQVRIDL